MYDDPNRSPPQPSAGAMRFSGLRAVRGAAGGRGGMALRRTPWAAAGAAFTLMILMPAATALALHAGHGSQHAQPGWLQTPDMRAIIKVYRVETGSVVKMPVHDYIVDVIAAEPGPGAPMEALKAAAVACRTYALYVTSHPRYASDLARRHGASLTDSGVVDLPWLTVADQQQRFGQAFALDEARLQQAVTDTAGQVLTYRGQSIPAFMFPLSVGRTRDARWVVGKPLPYLPAVACPDDLSAPDLIRTYTFTASAAARALGVSVSGWNPGSLRVAAADRLGYALQVTDGKRTWSGIDFANRLGLPSACFQLDWSAGGGSGGWKLRVTVSGIGPGLGMSLHEAEALAVQGRTWRDILRTFYPGAQLVRKGRW